ncbi:MAG: dipicolinate synthase subunit DpsA [Clostridia bacterium]|nr:dipicolinate synthase subunit DpsA [Clostridia bacterium]
MKQNSFAVIGGDFRSVMAAQQLAEAGFSVRAYGFDNTCALPSDVVLTDTLNEALSHSFYMILPLPALAPCGTKINTPLYSGEILVDDFIKLLPRECFVLGGMLKNPLTEYLKEYHIPFSDYFLREEFAVANAVPTAEGAIEIALRETPYTLCGSSCLIAGYGRIGKLLAKDLAALGASVTVCARRPESLAWIQANGFTASSFEHLEERISTYDIVFNTVPAPLFCGEMLRKIRKDTLIIDLASKPGGVDFEDAARLGLNVIWALSLPGKCAPKTAGAIICDTICNIIRETEVGV